MNLCANQTFNFFPVPTDIHFGLGIVNTLPERVKALGGHGVFLVTDTGIRQSGILDRIVALLEAESIPVSVCDRVVPDSGSNLIDTAASELKNAGSDVVVGLGGGSSLDTAKAIAALATNPGSCLDYAGLHKLRNKPLSVIAIPTTAGTGSEVTLWSVFTDEGKEMKTAIGSFFLYPSVALCDPELTLGLPAHLTAATGMDALGHAIECYTNNACQPISAALALRAIELIGSRLRGAVLRSDPESRYAMMLASTMAGIAMNPTRLGLAHALAMPLGSWRLRIPHGVAIAVMLPIVMEFNYPAHQSRFADVAQALGCRIGHLGTLQAAKCSVEEVRSLAQDIGIPELLSDCGLREEHVRPVVEEAMKSGNVIVNPRRTSSEDLERILQKAL